MIAMSLRSIAAAVTGRCVCDDRSESLTVTRVVTDSREARPGDLFVAIHGERLDGHAFVNLAAEQGATACMCAKRWYNTAKPDGSIPYIVVDDTIAALGRLAGHYRREVMAVGTTVVAVTGSNGKTTTKRMIDHVLAGSLRGRASPRSFNNHIGVPLTLLAAEADDQYLVLEIGSNAPGEVAQLAALAEPDVGVVTSIGEAHLEGLGDIEHVAQEKAGLLPHIRRHGLAVVNVDRPAMRRSLGSKLQVRLFTFGIDPRARLRVTDVNGSMRDTRFVLEGRFQMELQMPGVHHATNAAATFAVARWLGVDPEAIIARLRTFVPPDGRTSRYDVGGVTIIDDTYNANPTSVTAAIDTLRRSAAGRRVLVLGDMLELGDTAATLHQRVVRSAAQAGIEVLVAVGPQTVAAARQVAAACPETRVHCCDDVDAAAETLLTFLHAGDVVWIKGSRAMGLERVVSRLRERPRSRAAVA